MNSTLLRTAAPVWSAVDDALLLPAATPLGVVVAVDGIGTQDTSVLRQDVLAAAYAVLTGAGATSAAYAGRRSATSAAHTAATYAAHTSAARPSAMHVAPPSRGTPV